MGAAEAGEGQAVGVKGSGGAGVREGGRGEEVRRGERSMGGVVGGVAGVAVVEREGRDVRTAAVERGEEELGRQRPERDGVLGDVGGGQAP